MRVRPAEMIRDGHDAVADAADAPPQQVATLHQPPLGRSPSAFVPVPADSTNGDCRGVTVEGVTVNLGGEAVLRDVTVAARGGRTLALLGPSGCGKTTLLRVLAGLQRVHSGSVEIGGRTVASENRHVPPEARGVGMVFQDWALFPHLTVAANVAFGLERSQRRRGMVRRRPVPPRVTELLELLDIAELAHRLPGSLSGGQQQRVALARALAPNPSVLLLDEPFSSLDTSLRLEVRNEVAVILRELGVTCVFVTHDQDEAFVLGDEVAVMRNGRVVQQDPPHVLYENPVDRWVAGFVGEADTLLGTGRGAVASTPLGDLPLVSPALGAVDVLVRPEELILAEGTDATVDHIEYFGHDTLYHLRTNGGHMLHCRVNGAPRFAIGSGVNIRHSGAATVAYPTAPDS